MAGDTRRGRIVGVTGATSDLGSLLLPLLSADPTVEKIVAFDLASPVEQPKLTYQRVDLTRPGTEAELAEHFRESRIDTLYHLAFINSRVRSAVFAHELEVIGSMHVLAAAGAVGLPRLIFPSSTALYGARAQNPAFLTEQAPLQGSAGSRFINDKVEVEQQLLQFWGAHPRTHVVVLRFAAVVGPTANNPITRWLRTRLVPTVLGFDPLWQVIHEDDAADALHRALTTRAQGVFNVTADGVLPLSSLVRLSGGRVMPLPRPLLKGALRLLELSGSPTVPPALVDYLHYSWVADSSRAQTELGFVPRHSVRDAIAAFAST